MPGDPTPRRRFLTLAPAALVALARATPLGALVRGNLPAPPSRPPSAPGCPHRNGAPGAARPARSGAAPHPDHPDPRPDVDASKVLKSEALQNPAAAPVYDLVREIPHIVDGIRCYCGCADIPGYYSLLTCYEEGGMAQYCDICQGQARTVHGAWKEGATLDGIRAAVDRRWG